MIKVVIAEDVEVIREGLKKIIEQDEIINVCGLAENGNMAYDLCCKYNPDIVLMDIQMPECGGEEATRKIKAKFPDIKILVLTTFDNPSTVKGILSAGADGYILKGIDEEKLIRSIKSTVDKVHVLNESVFEKLKSKYVPDFESSGMLTKREREIVRLISQGNSNKQIAELLFISDGTVRNQVSNILTKLALKDRTQLAVYAIQNNL